MLAHFLGWLCLVTCLLYSAFEAKTLVIGRAKKDPIYRFEDQRPIFGPNISDQGISGYLALADPLTACGPVRPPPKTNVIAHKQWILLIKRGNCDFDEKVINAQMAGYAAAIVYNNESQQLIPMSGNHGEKVQIPSVFITYRDGIFLSADFLWQTGYRVALIPD